MSGVNSDRKLYRSKSYSNMTTQSLKTLSQAKMEVNKPMNPKREQIIGGRSINNQPNTQRTMNPELLDKEIHRPMFKSFSLRNIQSSGVISPDSKNQFIYYPDKTKIIRKKVDKRSYESFRFTDTPSNDAIRRSKKITPYGDNYMKSSVLKPTKQENYKEPDPMLQLARSMKFNSDFSSRVSCLPGRYTKEIREQHTSEGKKMVHSPNRSGNIYLSYNSTKQKGCDTFRKGRKITHNILEESKERRDENYLGKRHINIGVKNQFRSNFEIN